VSFRVTIPCTRAQGEAIADAEELFPDAEDAPVLVADEPDETKPNDWLIHAYFEHEPTGEEIAILSNLGSGPPEIEKLGEEDWVTLSQAGLQPIRAGRFTVHTPTYPPDPERINFEIDAGLAFGTGQHATTAAERCHELRVLAQAQLPNLVRTNLHGAGPGTGRPPGSVRR